MLLLLVLSFVCGFVENFMEEGETFEVVGAVKFFLYSPKNVSECKKIGYLWKVL